MQTEIEKKLEVLCLVDFFKHNSSSSLLPLASILKTHKFKMGQIVIKSKEIVDKFFIISEGFCRVIYEEQIKKTINNQKQQKIGIYGGENLISFNSKINNFDLLDNNSNKNKNNKKFNFTEEENAFLRKEKRRVFENDDKIYEKDVISYKKQLILRTYARGEYFGGRALFEDKDYTAKRNGDPDFERFKINQFARLTVVADTPFTELYSFDLKCYLFIFFLY